MKRLIQGAAGLGIWLWPAFIVGIGSSLASAQGVGSELHEVSFSLESVGLIIGIIVVVAPAFYFAGRYSQRLTVVEKELETIASEMSGLVLKNSQAIERMARAVESLNNHYPIPENSQEVP